MLVLKKIIDHHKIYVLLILRLSKHYSLDVGLNISLERWPIIFLNYPLLSFFDVKITYQFIVVVPTN